MYKIIDLEKWDRKDYYLHYTQDIPCTFSLVIDIDITNLLLFSKQHNIKLYPLLIHGLTKTVNTIEQFRYHTKDEDIILFDSLTPEYTILNPETKNFISLWTSHNDDIHTFNKSFMEDVEAYQNSSVLSPQENSCLNTYSISMLPWTDFKGFNLNLQNTYNYLQPIFTFGKYTKNDENVTIPLAIQVHHAVIDGYHVGLLVEQLQEHYNAY